ncbi:MAG: FeS assembly ATPase SufC, partial [Dehalococcoidia bacterium]|nr:FeS assembly ATPase SufC [Dehalococcoidia bacterium]
MADNGANSFAIEDLHVQVEGKEILKGVTLTVNKGEVHALMGPNGSGKSTLANTLMGNPNYKVTKGRVIFKGQDILTLTTDERAKLGIFLAFQYPMEIPGVKINNFVRMALKAKLGRDVSPLESWRITQQKMGLLEMDRALAERYVNEGFSGGEKKRNEILQMAVLE